MKQPDLGKKISELRLAKGLTQGELAEKCNLSLRTIQRIESAEVMPRSYTVKLIFTNLDYEIYNSFGKFSYKLDRKAYKLKTWLEQFYKYVSDLFNLKTDTMKKITILSTPFILLTFLLLLPGLNTKGQDKSSIRDNIIQTSVNLGKWFNAGQIDSIGFLYLENACMIPDNYREIHGRDNIKGYYLFLYNSGFRLEEGESKSTIIISDSIAVERGAWTSTTNNLTGTYLTQWRLLNGKWYIENEMTNTDLVK